MTTAVITGASGGVGSAIAGTLVDLGYRVIGLDLATPPPDHTWEHINIDLGDLQAVREAVRMFPGDMGIIVHSAADQPLVSAQTRDEKAWLRAWNVNLMSLQLIVAEMFPVLCSNDPRRVISVGSVHARHTSRGIAPYAVCKAALRAYVRSLALDASRSGLVAIDIEVGATDSPKLRQGLSRRADPYLALETLVGSLPAGRLVAREDFATLIRWLLEPAADHLTGGSVELSGGIQGALASEWGAYCDV